MKWILTILAGRTVLIFPFLCDAVVNRRAGGGEKGRGKEERVGGILGKGLRAGSFSGWGSLLRCAGISSYSYLSLSPGCTLNRLLDSVLFLNDLNFVDLSFSN